MERDAVIVAGFGFRAGAQPASLHAALALALAQANRPAIDALAAPADKLTTVAVLGAALGLPAIGVAPDAVRAAATITHGPASLAARGTGSVAEAAALAAAGAGARLLGPRHISPDAQATCALAQGSSR